MTQLLCFLSDVGVFSVTDRRVTWEKPKGTITKQEDVWNKAVIWGDRAVFTYTGAAVIKREPTDSWICTRVARVARIADAIETLRSELEVVFASDPDLHGRDLTIVVPGWSEVPGGVRPAVGVITNALKKGRPVVEEYRVGQSAAWIVDKPSTPSSGFETWTWMGDANISHILYVAGQSLSPNGSEAQTRASALLGRCRHELRRKRRPDVLLELLIRELRRGAGENRYVGASAMAVSVPKPDLTRTSGEYMLITGKPRPDLPTCF